MNFADLLNPELIICDLKGNSREAIYTEMLQRLKHFDPHMGAIPKILEEITSHEELIEMPYSCGFAVPHTRSAGVNDFHILVGIHKKGVLLKEDDLEPSKVVFLFLITKGTSKIYLLSLKAVCSYFSKNNNAHRAASCSSPEALIELLNKDKLEVKHSITAEDIMLRDFPSINENVMLKEAIDHLARAKRNQIAVVNDDLEFIGSFSIESILKASVPHYVLMMEHIEFISEFEPFEQVLSTEDDLPVSKFINRTPVTCSGDAHLMQIMVDLLKLKVTCYYVIDEDKKLVGLISKQELINNVLRR